MRRSMLSMTNPKAVIVVGAAASSTPALTSSHTTVNFSSVLNGTSGDLGVVVVGLKKSSTADSDAQAVPIASSGWTRLGYFHGGMAGSILADAGPTMVVLFAKVLTGSEGVVTITAGSRAPTSWQSISYVFRSTTGWRDDMATLTNSQSKFAADAVTGGGVSTNDPDLELDQSTYPEGKDLILAASVIPTDLGTAISTASLTLDQSTGADVPNTLIDTPLYAENSLGLDMAMATAVHRVENGAWAPDAWAEVTHSYTGASNQAGAVAVLVLRGL